MRIRVRSSRRHFNRITLNLASMIDVTFLLLIYFMVTMVLATPEDRLNSALHARTEPTSGAATDFQPQIVEVGIFGGKPGYQLGARVLLNKTSLQTALEPLNKATGLFIRVSDGPSVEFMVAAFQAGHDAGFEKITYVVPD